MIRFVDRRNSGAIKWQQYGDDSLPFWIADTEFATLNTLSQALVKYFKQGHYGYQITMKNNYKENISWWYKQRHSLNIPENWIIYVPTVMCALKLALESFTSIGESVVYHVPCYPNIPKVISAANRRCLEIDLKKNLDGKYVMDIEVMKVLFEKERPKMYVFCNPHNPTGRVFDKQEILDLFNLCNSYGVKIFSDEIHSDIVFGDNKHFSALTIEGADSFVVANSPNKPFNVANLQSSYLIVPDPIQRKKLQASLCYEPANYNLLPLVTLYTAQGIDYLNKELEILSQNLLYLTSEIATLPSIEMTRTEGTFLCWIEIKSNFKISLFDFFKDKGKLLISEGRTFSHNTSNFIRFNFACSPIMLCDGINRLKKCLEEQL
ncbi:cystathione beta-lyase [Pelosinus fermentans]|uniref:MalY/PatB family protein n=1 Tax=Pelosinus fermentans TaxID=365349 RepID=UPI0002684F91|nr:aminotransferase class I/II-fold pyridoxal phosphate-dependent enzyme [Pelosinus fermentans]OAM96300.1 Cystathionine beta-lyase [Pelosinus fermentans DSM 17108]SDR38602.1 cystathione beta-lyase [Pelosinus fermentans]